MMWLFSIGCTVFMGYTACTNDRGMVIDGLIHLDKPGATCVYWLVCFVGVWLIYEAARASWVTLRVKPSLEVTTDFIQAPEASTSATLSRVEFHNVQALRLGERRGHRFLEIRHGGETLCIREQLLPDRAAFEHVVQTIQHGLSALAQPEVG
jgi:hypothetical protein